MPCRAIYLVTHFGARVASQQSPILRVSDVRLAEIWLKHKEKETKHPPTASEKLIENN